MRNATKIGIWLCGLGMGTFLMVTDELINLSLYCGLRCNYPIPFFGVLDIWDAWALTFGVQVAIMTATLLIIAGDNQRVSVQ